MPRLKRKKIRTPVGEGLVKLVSRVKLLRARGPSGRRYVFFHGAETVVYAEDWKWFEHLGGPHIIFETIREPAGEEPEPAGDEPEVEPEPIADAVESVEVQS